MKLASLLKLSHLLSDTVWSLVQFWSPFSQTIIGNRFVQSLDEITVLLFQLEKNKPKNKEQYVNKLNLLLSEALIWLDKSRRRRLISNDDYQKLYSQLRKITIN